MKRDNKKPKKKGPEIVIPTKNQAVMEQVDKIMKKRKQGYHENAKKKKG